jgi:hypothetical protein
MCLSKKKSHATQGTTSLYLIFVLSYVAGKTYKETGSMASVELSLIDTLTFLTNQDLIFQVEQGPFHTQVLVQ